MKKGAKMQVQNNYSYAISAYNANSSRPASSTNNATFNVAATNQTLQDNGLGATAIAALMSPNTNAVSSHGHFVPNTTSNTNSAADNPGANQSAGSPTKSPSEDPTKMSQEQQVGTKKNSPNDPNSQTQIINGRELDQKSVQTVRELQRIETSVQAHEAAHMAAGGSLAGGASYGYTQGPDGKMYITSGEVPISMPSSDDPNQNIAYARQVAAAAMAPADPSPQDYKVAAQAAQMEMRARMDLSAKNAEEMQARTQEQKAQNEQQNTQNTQNTQSTANATNEEQKQDYTIKESSAIDTSNSSQSGSPVMSLQTASISGTNATAGASLGSLAVDKSPGTIAIKPGATLSTDQSTTAAAVSSGISNSSGVSSPASSEISNSTSNPLVSYAIASYAQNAAPAPAPSFAIAA